MLNPYDVLIKPVITEKAEGQRAKGVYLFSVNRRANKTDVANAVKTVFGVTPVKVNILNTRPRLKNARWTVGVKSGYKKAYVFLKKTDSINLFEA